MYFLHDVSFFVYLMYNKRRACIVTIVALVMNVVGIGYFDITKINMFYSFIYFVIGGLIFLYKDKIESFVSKYKKISIATTIFATILYFIIPNNQYIVSLEIICMYSLWLMLAIELNDNKFLHNKFTKFISKISLEIYLVHMWCFRIIEKMSIFKLNDNKIVLYFGIAVLVIIVATISSVVLNVLYKKLSDIAKNKLDKK